MSSGRRVLPMRGMTRRTARRDGELQTGRQDHSTRLNGGEGAEKLMPKASSSGGIVVFSPFTLVWRDVRFLHRRIRPNT